MRNNNEFLIQQTILKDPKTSIRFLKVRQGFFVICLLVGVTFAILSLGAAFDAERQDGSFESRFSPVIFAAVMTALVVAMLRDGNEQIKFIRLQIAQQGSADEPATAPQLEPTDDLNPNPNSKPRPQ